MRPVGPSPGDSSHADAAPPAQAARSSWFAWLMAAVLAAAVLAVHRDALEADFVYDDLVHVVERERDIASPEASAAWLLGTQRPVVRLTLAANHAWGGIDPAGYHAFNLAVHACAAVALLFLVRGAGRALAARGAIAPDLPRIDMVAFAAAALWSLHPLTTAAATSVVQRAESLAALFTLLSALALLRAARAPRLRLPPSLACGACVLLALASKPTAASAPAALLALDAFVVEGSLRAALRRRWPLHLANLCFLALPLSLGIGEGIFGGDGTLAGYGAGVLHETPLGYAAAQVRALGLYLAMCADPSLMSIDHGPESLAPWWTLPLGAALLAAAVAAIALGWRRGAWWAAVPAVFLALLAPTTSFIPLADPAADQRMYLPLAVLAVAAAVLLLGVPRRAWVQWACLLAAIAAISLEARAVRTRNAMYADPVLLWDDVAARRPMHARAFVNRASLLVARGELDRAAPDIARAAELQPGNPDTMFLLAVLDMRDGRAAEALARLDVVANATVADARVYGLRGDAMRALGRPADAAQAYRNAAMRAPSDARFVVLAGRALLEAGDAAAAEAAFDEALAIDPSDEDAARGREEARRDGR